MTHNVIFPDAEGEYVALTRTKVGKLFRKQIFRKGEFFHPAATGGKVEVTDEFMGKIVDNFEKGVCPIVQFPLANKDNQHVEDVESNAGEVVSLEKTNEGLFAVIDVRKANVAAEVGNTILGASAFVHTDYVDTRTGEPSGPTLLHVCATNRPHLVDLDDYEQVIAATASDSQNEKVLLLSSPIMEENSMTLDEMLAELKDKHGLDVPALQAAAKAADTVSVALSSAMAEAGVLKLSNGDTLNPDDMVKAVSQLASETLELSNTIKGMKQTSAESKVDGLVEAGRVKPADRDDAVSLLLTSPSMFEKFVATEPLLPLTAAGTTVTVKEEIDLDAYAAGVVSRLTGK